MKRRLEEPSETETRIGFVDSGGHLSYRGVNIHDMAKHSIYEETIYLLLYGKLPTKTQLLEMRNKLSACRRLPAGVVALISSLPHFAAPMDVLRTAISAMAMFDPNEKDNRIETLLERGIGQIAQATTIVTTHNHLGNSRLPIEPDPEMGHAESFLYMLKGREPEAWETKALDLCLVLHADHGLNASTFAARATASARVLDVLGKNNISVLMISQSSSEADLSLIVARSSLERAAASLRYSLLNGRLFKEVTTEADVSVVAAVGAGMKGTPGIAARLFRAVADKGVNVRMIAQGSSELNISFVVREDDVLKSVRALHQEFQLGQVRA